MSQDRFPARLPATLTLLIVICTPLFAQPEETIPNDPMLQEYQNITTTLLAQDVKQTYGGDAWSDSLSFAFDFVVYDKDHREIARYHNEWNRLTDEALLSGKLRDGRSYRVEFSDLSQCQGKMFLDSQEVAPAVQKSALPTYYDRLVSNFRWLLTPLRLFDPDVTLQGRNDSIVDAKPSKLMSVVFSDTLAPSACDILLFINNDHKLIERWRMNYDGVYRQYRWQLTQRVGPFIFPTRLLDETLKTYIQFEQVQVIRIEKEGNEKKM